MIKRIALEKLHRDRILKEYVTVSLKNTVCCLISNGMSKFEE